jgi:hypothetical protein
VSYWHIRQGALDHAYDQVGASILPLSVDGLLIVSARYVTRSKTILAKIIAALGFVLGMLATLAGNLLTSDGTMIGTGFATWPAVAVIVTAVVLHLGESKPKPKTQPRAKTTSKAPSSATSATKPTIPDPATPADSIKPTARTAA